MIGAVRLAERQTILPNGRLGANESVAADAYELMGPGEGPQHGAVADFDVAGEGGAVGENAARSDAAVVRHVRIGKKDVFVSNDRLPRSPRSAAMHGGELTEDVARAHD